MMVELFTNHPIFNFQDWFCFNKLKSSWPPSTVSANHATFTSPTKPTHTHPQPCSYSFSNLTWRLNLYSSLNSIDEISSKKLNLFSLIPIPLCYFLVCCVLNFTVTTREVAESFGFYCLWFSCFS